jgi:hypothetical protein
MLTFYYFLSGEKTMKCLVCEKASKSRGLCSLCYQAASQRVKSGKVTWGQLEAVGLAKPAKNVSNAQNAFSVAFAEKFEKPEEEVGEKVGEAQ